MPPKSSKNTEGLDEKLDNLMAKMDSHEQKYFEKIPELEKSVNFLSERFDKIQVDLKTVVSDCKSFKKDISALQAETRFQRNAIVELRHELDQQINQVKSIDIEIKGIPHTQGENLIQLISFLASKAGFVRGEDVIAECYRLKSLPNSGSIVCVRMKTAQARSELVRLCKKKIRLTLADINLGQATDQIFVNEAVSKTMILALSIQFKRNYGYKFCWLSHGRVYLRRSEADAPIMIKDEWDLDKLKP